MSPTQQLPKLASRTVGSRRINGPEFRLTATADYRAPVSDRERLRRRAGSWAPPRAVEKWGTASGFRRRGTRPGRLEVIGMTTAGFGILSRENLGNPQSKSAHFPTVRVSTAPDSWVVPAPRNWGSSVPRGSRGSGAYASNCTGRHVRRPPEYRAVSPTAALLHLSRRHNTTFAAVRKIGAEAKHQPVLGLQRRRQIRADSLRRKPARHQQHVISFVGNSELRVVRNNKLAE